MPNSRPHEWRTELRVGCKPLPMARLYVLKNSLPANLHCQLGRQFRVKDRREQIIERRERDRATLVQQAKILGMGIGVADNQVEDRRIQQFQSKREIRRTCS